MWTSFFCCSHSPSIPTLDNYHRINQHQISVPSQTLHSMVRTSSRLAAVAEKAKAKALAEEQATVAQEKASTIKVEHDANANAMPARKKRAQPNPQHSKTDAVDDEVDAGIKRTHTPKRDATTTVSKKPAAMKKDPVKMEEGSMDLKATKRKSSKEQSINSENHLADPTTSLVSDNSTATVPTIKTRTTTATAGKAEKLKAQSKKRKVDEEDECINDDDHRAQGSESEPVKGAKRPRRNTKQDAVSEVKKHQEVPKGTNPCAWLPTEVWHVVLSYLPLSQVAVISLVNTTWLDGCRSYPVWRIICEKNKVGPPKSKYKSYMALACKYSYFICDRCHSLTMKGQTKSEVTLPMKDKDDNGVTWLLCLKCRLEHHRRHPVKLKNKKDAKGRANVIARTRASYEYQLTTSDLDRLPCTVRPNPHYRNGPPMRLYSEIQVEKLALRIHGGPCGLTAAASDVLKKKRDSFKRRDVHFNKAPTFRFSQEQSSQEQDWHGHGSQEQSSHELATQEEQVSQEQASQVIPQIMQE